MAFVILGLHMARDRRVARVNLWIELHRLYIQQLALSEGFDINLIFVEGTLYLQRL